jgi:hypothetical protein
MVLSDQFIGTTSSTVSDLVRAYRAALNLADNFAGNIGDFRRVTRPVAEATAAIQRLATLVAANTFDEGNMRMTAVQRELLDRITAGELRSVDEFFSASYEAGEKRVSVVAKKLYQRFPHLAEKSKQYNTKFSRDIHTHTVYHWFKAMVELRLNPYLMHTGQHIWKQEMDELVQSPAMSEAVFQSALGEVPLHQLQADDTLNVALLGPAHEVLGSSGSEQPTKRQRLDEQGRSGQASHDATQARSSSSTLRAWGHSAPGTAPAATPKSRPSNR